MATAASVLRPVSTAPQRAWLKWTVSVSLAEMVAFALPLSLGVLASRSWGLDGFALWGVIVAAGAAEGLVLGTVQGFAVRLFLPRANVALWTLATVVAATAAWAFAWLPPTYADRGEPAGIVAGITILAIGVVIIALTVPQAEVLSFAKVRHAYMWVPFSALAWGVALPAVLAGGLFVDGASSAPQIIGAFAVGAVAMAVIMAAVTGWAMAWIAAHEGEASSG